MGQQPLLEGPRGDADDPVRLRREIAGLELELQAAKDEAAKAKQAAADSVKAIRVLRHELEPLYTSLRMIFGEISRVDAEEAVGRSGGEASSPSNSRKWELWKTKLPGRPAEFIDLLLAQGSMTQAQIAAAAHCDRRTVIRNIHVLNKAQLVNKNGNMFSLKDI